MNPEVCVRQSNERSQGGREADPRRTVSGTSSRDGGTGVALPPSLTIIVGKRTTMAIRKVTTSVAFAASLFFTADAAHAQTSMGSAMIECTRYIQQYRPNFDVYLDMNSMFHYRPNTSSDEVYAFDKCMNIYGVYMGPVLR